MKLILKTPKQSLSKAYLKKRPLRSDIDLFKTEFANLLNKIDNTETEEFHKNIVSDFFKKTVYPTNFINTKGRQDIVIHNGADNKTSVGVIIEAKRPSNKTDWFTADNPNSKALHELVLYYLRERIECKNIDIKFIIATNISEWYIFEASLFEKLFYRNKQLVKHYEEWRDGKKVSKDTNLFYTEIVKPYINSIQDEVVSTYFNINDYRKTLLQDFKKDDKNLISLLKILSPQHLLKIPFTDDTNELDQNFYKELLHIVGLAEKKKKGKKPVLAKEPGNPASLLELTIQKLKTKGIHKLSDVSIFGKSTNEQYFNIALQLCITWINRILFLKLLEGQLIIYHKGDTTFRFLNSSTVHDFDELFKLFHQVLAVDVEDRDSEVKKKYNRIPYLNSSLFDISELEDLTITIDSLDNSESLPIIPSSILKSSRGQYQSLKTLDYLFQFLESYDFASEGAEDIQEDNRPLINASVLGKVFEKINGYKEGSIYTPGFITMSMCRHSIRLAVVQKFNEIKGWDINHFDNLYNTINDTNEANDIINSIKICDPAVGSGHFLVSALNEIISIKSELRILKDRNGKRLKEYNIHVENDELFIEDEDGDLFQYTPANEESQRVQEAIFFEKQTIIENCLFGVDINPNSVKICRLRLWIELLKNSFYRKETHYTQLETLPNIDINIKCGNSLLSRFKLDEDLTKALKSIKYDIKAYREFVNAYKSEKDREVKRGLQIIIDKIKSDFRAEIFNNDPKVLRLKRISGKLFTLLNQKEMFLDAKQKKSSKQLQITLEAQIEKLSAEIEKIKTNAVYKNAFEWRFEFPEVLNNNGDFEGFDLIIGNPPYISAMELKKSVDETTYLQMKKNYETAKGTVDLFIYFFERGIKLLKDNFYLSYITPNRYLSASYGEAVREYLYNQSQVLEILDYSHVRVFKEASTYPIVTSLRKRKTNGLLYPIIIGKFNEETNSQILKNVTSERLSFLEGFIWGYLLNEKIEITEKVINQSLSITDCAAINATSTAGEADNYHTLINDNEGWKLINTGTIDRFENSWGKQPLIDKGKKFLTPHLAVNSNVISKNRINLYGSPKIILAKIALRTEAFYDMKGEYASINTNCFHKFDDGFKPEYILAWLNSKLFQYTFECFFEGLRMQGGYLLYSAPNVSKMFIKKISSDLERFFIGMVKDIIKAKEMQLDTTNLEQQIDDKFYELFSLDPQEIKTIEQAIR